MSGREKNNLAEKQWFYSTTCGERTNTAEYRCAYKIQPYLKLFENVGKKPQHVFGGPGRKVFWGVFIIFRLRKPIPPIPQKEKIFHSQNSWQ